MIIVDTALQKRLEDKNPVRVALVGAGFMGRGVATQILTAMPGMRLVAVCSRDIGSAQRAYRESGIPSFRRASSPRELETAMADAEYVVTDDPDVICGAAGVEAVIEATGDIEYGSRVALAAVSAGKHLVSMNAEVDATLGPILKVHADRSGVVYTYTDGDEPGVAMNLFRFVQGIGCRPVMAGQIKGFLDRYRNPQTQEEFARKHGQKPAMIASFADGSKLAIESVIFANGSGFVPAVRGMRGHRCDHVSDLLKHYSERDFESGGLVEYALGAAPHSGAFVVAHNNNPIQQKYMSYFKMGDGPLYVFYTPYHLPHLQLPMSVARAVLFHDPTLTPRGAPVCDTLTVAKRDLKAGELLDGMGGFTCYGLIDTYAACSAIDALPMPLSIGCRLKKDIAIDQPVSYSDVELPSGRLCDRLRAEQKAHFS